MKKSFAAIFIALAGVIGSAGEQIDLFQNREAWTLPASSGWKDDTLRVTVLPNNHNKRGTNTAQMNLAPEKIRGKYLRFTCEAKGENLNIAELERPYLGFKFMLIVKSEKETSYPGGGRNAVDDRRHPVCAGGACDASHRGEHEKSGGARHSLCHPANFSLCGERQLPVQSGCGAVWRMLSHKADAGE